MSLKPLPEPVIFVDVFTDVVEKVKTEAIARGICSTLRSFHGPVEDLEMELRRISASIGLPDYEGDPGFPCIFLLQDFPEQMGTPDGFYSDPQLPMVAIMTATKQNYSSADRYTYTFRPILYPLYYLFLKHLAQDGRILMKDPDLIVHTKYDRLYYGRRKFGTAVTEYVDAIELNNIKLTTLQVGTC